MARFRQRSHRVNGIRVPGGIKVPFTAVEEAQADADKAAQVIRKQAEADVAAQKATDKASGNQKLLDLGLSQAEVDALTG